jgi:hypothetical protein
MFKSTEFSTVDEVENYILELGKFAERVPSYQSMIELEIETIRREIESKKYQNKNGSLPLQSLEAVVRP